MDFTHGNATYYRRHYLEIISASTNQIVDSLLSMDPRLKKLAEMGISETEPTFLGKEFSKNFLISKSFEYNLFLIIAIFIVLFIFIIFKYKIKIFNILIINKYLYYIIILYIFILLNYKIKI